MITSDIIIDVVDRVQDDSFDEAVILRLINEGRFYAAAEVDLPALQKSATVITTAIASTVALPIDYHKGVFWVGSTVQGRRIGTRPGDYYNLLTFMERFPIVAGPIESVCVDGTNLLHQGMAADTLLLKYYCKPTIITATTVAPTELPYHLHRPLLTAYCCREIYADIEDGMEGQKVNAMYWSKKFDEAMLNLASFSRKNTPREAKYMRDMGA